MLSVNPEPLSSRVQLSGFFESPRRLFFSPELQKGPLQVQIMLTLNFLRRPLSTLLKLFPGLA